MGMEAVAGKNNIYGVGDDNIYGSVGHDTFDGGAGDDHYKRQEKGMIR